MSNPNRRTFLASTAVTTATAARLSAADGAALRVGFIGVGSRGTALLRNFLDAKLGTVVAVCDLKDEHAKRASALVTGAGQKAPTLVEDWKKLLEMKDVQAVVSALPCDLHAACYLDAIGAEKDLYGEKPMCLTPQDCDRVVKATGASKQVVQIGFQRRADPRFIEPMKLIHEGELGALVEGRVMWSNSWGPLGDWFGKKARSGDWMVEQACHNWDVINWACRGLPVRAMGMGRAGLFKAFQPDRDVHDYYSAVVEYENGVIVNILHSWVAPGQNGKFTKEFNDEYTRLNGVKAGIDFNTGVIAYRKELNLPDKVGHSAKGAINNTRLGLEAFADSVRTRKAPVATVEHGRDAVLACLLVREAVYQKKPITMKELRG
ncbi:Inositol 2-dehydrogenase [Gemmata obscuriglobus]|uniref:Gfo/Idh/MocA family oxidoreductase n=1 Tax=Gemmata obscuriglobus TaxID=114 RepID=A0A2Z3GWL6_9BACT|nr:Gfo/Idh/MocA family oxidoreductase [Gemmata obscuriglobus]AWM35766.1 gfo/Idh/MocA family oxidoreductase [Gemmata obscuriglobus]QEG31696.1 Inositol 2-dehydrogenase [Gemmata obscuriglobus]VTS11042.1 oxidoreductase : Putative dehydrogenase OS=Singulisphaera acidiphila (strain ATCC BAA-1392 / DSM 18658 / VKM B-2454 / MOB10) GN=Sinac_5086 PE=4 SV=1: GFO_IDH_MocA [Gemmata obscuriglobus UQM 2246]